VNGSESEPASHKDRTLLRLAPHLVLDGAVIVAEAIGARRVEVAVHDPAAQLALEQAGSERAGTGSVPVRVTRTRGGFVAGEARAVLRGLAGQPQLPPGRREPPTAHGVLLANAETFAQVAVLTRLGAQRFADSGTAAEPGTTLITVDGAVARPGVVELPLGTPLGILLGAAGAAPLQAVITGGYHGSWLPADPALRLSRTDLAAVGGRFGAGVVLAVGQDTCALGELARVAGWLAGESAGQCGPCRFGLPALANDVRALLAGDARALPGVTRHAQVVTGRGACSHPDGVAAFVTSGLRLLHGEVTAHLSGGGCGRPTLGLLPLGERPIGGRA
jgi:NADH:ubiquinone oxidoreductase subunit F (NADH-binding)